MLINNARAGFGQARSLLTGLNSIGFPIRHKTRIDHSPTIVPQPGFDNSVGLIGRLQPIAIPLIAAERRES
jgi:hypothetical protein